MTVALALAIGFGGLLIGSYVNVVAYRIPNDLSVLSPPSSCPKCGARIRPRDNIPIVSWVVLRGRCRDCGAPISIRYPIVELATGVVFGVAAGVIGASWVLVAYLWFGGVTVALFLTDLDHKRIPNRILYPATVVAVVLLAAGAVLDGESASLWRALAAGAVYFGILLAIAILARGGFGMGDVKLAFLLGMFTGYASWDALGVGVVGGFVIGGLISVVLLILRRAGRKDAIPFGPAMILGAYVAIVWGDAIGEWYLG